MRGWFRVASAIAGASVSDALRRPGFILGAVALGALLGVLPHLGNPAAGLADNRALAVELSLSTLGLVGPAVAGLLAVRSVQTDHGSGWVPELRTGPGPEIGVLVGRYVACAVVSLAVCCAGVALGAIGWIGVQLPNAPMAAASAGLIAGGIAATAVGAAIGLLYGSAAPREFAAILVVVHVLGARWIGSAVGETGAAFADPSRLDLAREVAFGAPVGLRWAALAVLGSCAQATALVLLAAYLLSRRARSTGS